MRLKTICKYCSRPLVLTHESILNDGAKLKEYKCGHAYYEDKVFHLPSTLSLTSMDGKKTARPYQQDAVEYVFGTDWNCLIADQVGLGKTAQAIWSLVNAPRDAVMPCLAVVKSATIWQWLNQVKEWGDNSLLGVYVITGQVSKSFIPPGFRVYIISMDTFSRMVKLSTKTIDTYDTMDSLFNPKADKSRINVDINPQLKNLGIKSMIIDECQSFKDTSSKRTQALVGFIKHMEIEHKLFLSATPIKNKADEYFTTLNLIAPEKFPSIQRFRRDWLMQDDKGKWSQINPYRQEEFRDLISEFVLRRETKDVLKDLPPFRREFELINLEDENLIKLYNLEIDKLRIKRDRAGRISWADFQENLMTLRRITGLAKVGLATEYIDTFLDTSETEKIAIGIHHEGVRDNLYLALDQRGFNPLKLSGEDNSEKKQSIVREFQKPNRRVLIINMLAGGVGIDGLEVCNNMLGLERQWNSVDEEQWEGRFAGARQAQSHLPVYCEYWIAKNTIDEFFHDLVEEKRQICHDVISNDWNLASDSNMLRDLVERTSMSKL